MLPAWRMIWAILLRSFWRESHPDFFSEGAGQGLKDEVSAEFWDDITHFEGNANGFRILTHQLKSPTGWIRDDYPMLAAIVKYPFASSFGREVRQVWILTSEVESYQKVAEELGILRKSKPGEPLEYARHPLVYMVEAADDICYEIMDIEDSHKLKILSFEETANLLLGFFDEETQQKIRQRILDEGLTDENEQVVYMRACVIGKLENECVNVFLNHEEEILAGTFEGCLIEHIAEHQRQAYQKCTQVSRKKIYASKPVLDIELSGYKIMATLMEVFIDAAVNPSRFYSKQLLRRVSSQYDIENENLEERIMAILDYISGMTDIYALDIYQKINGISLPIV